MGCGSTKPAEKAGEASGTQASNGGSSSSASKSKSPEEKLLDKYVLGKVIGQGAFGVVYSCKKKGTKEEYAVKMIDQVETPLLEIKQEANMLKELMHSCVVKLHDVYYEKVFVCMVLELYKGGDMIEGMQLHWKSKGVLAISVVQNISKMMVQSIDWLHGKNVVHRDLKGDNFLMDRKAIEHPQCRIFLSDFGTVQAIAVGERLKHKCGTKTYWSPEFYNLSYGLPVDIWAIGVIMFGLVTGRFPFKGEEDCKNKAVKCPARATKDGEAFILGTLNRDEAKRLKAQESLSHAFLCSIKSAAQVAEEKQEQMDVSKLEIRETGANAGIQERRRELVERLNQAHNKGGKPGVFTQYKEIAKGFVADDQSTQKKTNFDWWNPEQVAKEKLFDELAAREVKDMDEIVAGADSGSEGLVQMLKDHGIETSSFGQGKNKTFEEFANEVQTGQSVLMIDASKHKNLVRVVDVVLLRIRHGTGGNRYLVKTREKFPDGRERDEINQITGTKKLPHESAKQTASRLLQDRLQLEDGDITFDWTKKEVFESEEVSNAYPIRTLYRKEIYEGVVVTTNADTLKRVRLQGQTGEEAKFEVTCSKKYCRTYQWLTEAECKKKDVTLRATKAGTEFSPLVHAPIGFEAEELQNFLQTNNIQIEKFGTAGVKTLAEFSDELVRGESQLVRMKAGNLMRLVDVVILKIMRTNKDAIIEVSETDGSTVKSLKRFPAVKRRPDENPFWAAKRVLNKVLKMDENMVTIDPKACYLSEEQKDSVAYAGMPTMYRRLIVPAVVEES